MFDLSFGEVVVVAVVALLVLGPERLPIAARKLAALVRHGKNEMDNFRQKFSQDLDIESELAELKQELQALRQQSNTIFVDEKQRFDEAQQAIVDSVSEAVADIKADIAPPMSDSDNLSDSGNKPPGN
jgi:sec-independent protein translocase protein TatB